MAEQWIVRVQGREYGPVGLEELLEWKREGRLIRENEIRESESDHWFRAGELPEVFADETAPEPPPLPPPPVVRPVLSFGRLLLETCRIYGRGFGSFLGLSALVVLPSVCTQLSGAVLGSPTGTELDLRSTLAALFNLCMLLASIGVWPIYIAGIQILTHELAEGRSTSLGELVAQTLKFWPRVAVLCLLVYGAFFLLLMLAFVILVMVATSAPSIVGALFALLLLAVQVWMFGRLFVAVLFWQQPAVLEDAGVVEALRRSSELARSRRDLLWPRRPLWQGAFIASLWSVLAIGLMLGAEWTTITGYFRTVTTTHDPQAILQAMTAASKPAGLALLPLLFSVLGAILRPLLGIAFVLVYLHSQNASRSWPND